MEKVLLAVYGIDIYRRNDRQIPSNFGGSVDFLNLFHEFAGYVLANIQTWSRPKKSTLALTCPSLPFLSLGSREVYGFFHAGRDGELFDVRNLKVPGASPVRVTRDLHSIRDAFFYLHVPPRRQKAYLVLQRANSQGIKELVGHFLWEFMNMKGLQDFRVIFSNLINDQVFVTMMTDGNFKELTLTKLGIPRNIDDLVKANGNRPPERIPIEPGTVKTTFQSYNLGDTWKKWIIDKVEEQRRNERPPRIVVEINEEPEEYDEVSAVVELNGKRKTFRLANSSRIQPDIDVTDNVGHEGDGRLSLVDLLIQARDLVASVSLDINRDDISI